MDWISILGVFGTIATLIFGIYSIVLAYKRNVTGTLMFIEESYIDFQDVMIQNSKSLKIFYENEEIQNETYLLRGFFISRGKEDITTQMIEKNIKIILPHGKKRLMSKIISKSQDLIAELNICDNVLELNSGLIKYNEYVYFEGLIDSDKTKLQAEEIKFEHRIANTTSIIRKKVDDFKNLIQASLSLLFLSFMFIFFVGNPIKVNEYQLNGSFVDSKNHQINYNKKHLEGLVASLESYKIREKIYSDYNNNMFAKIGS